MVKFASAAQVRQEVGGLLRPPRRRKVSDVGKESLKIMLPSGATGPWDDTLTPYMIEPMNLLNSREYDAVIFVAPARTGKTIALDCWIAYMIVCDPSDMMVVHTSKDLARDYSKRRVDRFIRNSPDLKANMSSASSDDNTFDKTLRNGALLNISWPTIKQLSSRDIKLIASTDYDRRASTDVDGEGELFTLMQKRVETFMSSGMCYVESSPGFEISDPDWEPPKDGSDAHILPPAEGIVSLYNQGDRRRFYWQCTHCSDWFQPVMENFNYLEHEDPLIASESVAMECPHCHALMGSHQRRELNLSGRWVREGQSLTKDGEVVGSARRSRIASFSMEGPVAAFQTWESQIYKLINAEDEFKLTGDETKIKATMTVDQGRPYLSRARKSNRDPNILKKRAEETGKRVVPPGVRFLTGQVDVQAGKDRRFVCQVIGWGPYGESWLIDRFNLRWVDDNKEKGQIDPAANIEHWDILISKIITRSYPIDDDSGRSMKIKMTACDSGGADGVTDNAYKFWRKCRKEGLSRDGKSGDKFLLVKGEGGQKTYRTKLTFPDNTGRADRKAAVYGEVPLMLINSNMLKDTVDANMKRADVGPGYMHYPDWIGDWFYKELTYETRTPKGWVKPGSGDNEAFDLYVYGQTVCITLGVDAIDWEKPPRWADEWDRNSEVVDPNDSPEPAKKPTFKRRTRFKF